MSATKPLSPAPPLTGSPGSSRSTTARPNSRLLQRIGRRRQGDSRDPAITIMQRHSNDLKRVDFISDQIDRMTVLVETRKVELATLRNKNEKLDDELFDLTSKTGTALSGTALDDVQRSVDRTIVTLQSKLETSLQKSKVRVDSERSEQKLIKQEINEYRKKKMLVRAVNERLEEQLCDHKDDLIDRLHDLQKAQEQRSVFVPFGLCCTISCIFSHLFSSFFLFILMFDSNLRLHTEAHVMALKKMLQGVEHTFATEWSSLTSRINKERFDIEDVQRRSAESSNWEVEVGKGGSILKAVQAHAVKQNNLQDRVKNAQWAAAQQRLSYRQAQAQLDEYREALALLHKRLEVRTAEELIEQFDESETTIFSRLRQINELTSQTEKLDARKKELKDDLERVEQTSRTSTLHKKRERKTLDDKENSIKRYVKRINLRLTAVTKIVQTLTEGVAMVYSDLNCEKTVPSASDGVALGGIIINPINLMLYLGIVQERASNVLMLGKVDQSKRNTLREREKKEVREREERKEQEGDENHSPSSPSGGGGSTKKKKRTTRSNNNNAAAAAAAATIVVAGPLSPVRNSHDRILKVDLNGMSAQLEKIEKAELLSQQYGGGGREVGERGSGRRGRRRSTSGERRRSRAGSVDSSPSGGGGGGGGGAHRRSPSSPARSSSLARSQSPIRAVAPPMATTPLSRTELLDTIRTSMMLTHKESPTKK